MFYKMLPQHKTAYEKKGITNTSLLRRMIPIRYKDYSKAFTLKNVDFSQGSKDIAVIATIIEVKKKQASGGGQMLSVKAIDQEETPFRVMYMRGGRLKPLFESFIGQNILLMGPFQFDPRYGYSVFSPAFSKEIKNNLKIIPVYSTFKSITPSENEEYISHAISEIESETVPERLLDGMPDINHAVKMVHSPNGIEDAEKGRARLILDDIIYFKLMLLSEQYGGNSKFRMSKTSAMEAMLNKLPYKLTVDQKNTIDKMITSIDGGKRLNALVQGDVGCGKTIIAICMMVCAADNGYQSILMAPTQILAEQHISELLKYVCADEIVFFDGSTKGKARKAIEAKVRNGTAKFIVGTSALLTSDIPHDNVGIVIIDEEHRFGVEQRSSLCHGEAHMITMSATPIPRSLAKAVYGDGTEIYQVREKPAGRLPVITYYDNGKKDKAFLLSMLKKGGQAYVVCPLKEEAETGSIMENVQSAGEIYEEYRQKFGSLGYQVDLVTGTTKPADKDAILARFKSGTTHILVSTTVIEVGVNVPNANVIVIKNAERFGLATLHQLRGRVGRGGRQSYCILVSDMPNSRIRAMCMTGDGFKIAEVDLKERRSGDLLGIRQSGKNRFVEEILTYPEIEKKATNAVENMNYREALAHIKKYEKIFEKTE